MKQKLKLFILLFIFLLVGCNTSKTNYELSISIDSKTIMLGDEVKINVNQNVISNVIFESSDESIAIVDDFGYIIAVNIGEVTIKAYLEIDESISDEINIKITDSIIKDIKIKGSTIGNIGDTLVFTYSFTPKTVSANVTWLSDNTDIAIVNQNGEVTLVGAGMAKITLSCDDENNFTKSFYVGSYDYTNILVDPNSDLEVGEEVYFNDLVFNQAFTCVKTIKDALANVTDGGTIYIKKGTYDESAIISKNGITIIGESNNKVDNTDNDTIITKALAIAQGIENIKISSLTFINKGQIYVEGDNKNITISNNKFTENVNDIGWKQISNDACLLIDYHVINSDNITISDNLFYNINNYAISFTYVDNIKIVNNTFKNFNLDAIRLTFNDISKSCQYLIRGNKFIDGAYNAIYFHNFGAKVVNFDHIISIYENYFENIGNNHTDNMYYGAITMYGFNSGTASLSISYNEFINNKANILIDNSCDERFSIYYACNISYNKFKGEDLEYYFTNKTNSLTLNSFKTTNLYSNLYLDNKDNVINPNDKITGALINESHLSIDEYNNIIKVFGEAAIYIGNDTNYVVEDDSLSFESSNEKIFKVDNKGLISGISEGNAQLIIKKDNKELTRVKIFVKDAINIDYASLIVSIALNEEGYVEGNNNYTKYGVWYGKKYGKEFENGAWCAMFVSWCANQANIPTTIIPEYASVAAGRQWFEKNSVFKYKEEYTPKTGDIIFFLSNGASHTGIVVDYRNGTVYTIEGNTSDMCHQRSYDPMNAKITGYGVPNYPVFTGEKIEFDVSTSTDGSNESTR